MFKWIKRRKQMKEAMYTNVMLTSVILSKVYDVVSIFDALQGGMDVDDVVELASALKGLDKEQLVSALVDRIKEDEKPSKKKNNI